MRVAGYKLNGYNATYEPCELDIRTGKNSRKNRVLEMTDVDSGITYIFETEERVKCNRQQPKVGVWRSEK